MPEQQTVTFQQALETIEALPGYQQDDLMEIIRRRRLEQRRDSIATRISEAKQAYARGEVSRGTVQDFMRDVTE
ncbi:MAG: hypothetical protein GY856_24580 [bacterium]|nr:hypothetical protein [bacterium]